MVDRVRRSPEYDEILNAFREKKIFSAYKDALLFAACLGFNRKKRVQFSKTSEMVHLVNFRDEYNESIINILAVAEKSDLFLMNKNNEEEKIRIFEEYACGGLEIIKSEVWETNSDLGKGLELLIMQEIDDEDKVLSDITGISFGL